MCLCLWSVFAAETMPKFNKSETLSLTEVKKAILALRGVSKVQIVPCFAHPFAPNSAVNVVVNVCGSTGPWVKKFARLRMNPKDGEHETYVKAATAMPKVFRDPYLYKHNTVDVGGKRVSVILVADLTGMMATNATSYRPESLFSLMGYIKTGCETLGELQKHHVYPRIPDAKGWSYCRVFETMTPTHLSSSVFLDSESEQVMTDHAKIAETRNSLLEAVFLAGWIECDTISEGIEHMCLVLHETGNDDKIPMFREVLRLLLDCTTDPTDIAAYIKENRLMIEKAYANQDLLAQEADAILDGERSDDSEPSSPMVDDVVPEGAEVTV